MPCHVNHPEALGQRVGVLGGTFDPVHNGHLAAAIAARETFSLDSLLFVPAAQPPHKQRHSIASFKHRVAMLEKALGGQPGFFISCLEAERAGPSYSIDTLIELRRQLGEQAALFFVIGRDAFMDIASWKEYERLPLFANLVVIDRPGRRQEGLAGIIKQHFKGYRHEPRAGTWSRGSDEGKIYALCMKPVPVSSTEVRKKVATGLSISDLVSSGVGEYIATHCLYK